MSLTSNSPGLVPHPKKGVALNDNYLNFADGSGNDFAQQYLPELYEAEVERYGNRTISGFLRMVGAEMPMSSDQVIWSEQNRLHIAYENVVVTDTDTLTVTLAAADSGNMAIKVDQLMVVMGAAGEMVVRVTAVAGAGTTWTVDVDTYTAAGLVTADGGLFTAADAVVMFVFGSEYEKGSATGPGRS